MTGIKSEIIPKILHIWNYYLKNDPTNPTQLSMKYFENPYLNIEKPIYNEGAFSLLCTRNLDQWHNREDYGKAWIMAAGFKDKNSLEELLDEQLENLRLLGIREVYFSNFSPGYFLPGIDVNSYPELYHIFKAKGFAEISKALAMDLELNNFIPEKYSSMDKLNDIDIMELEESIKEDFIRFLQINYPGDCFLRALGVVEQGSLEQITVALKGGKIIGYSMYSSGEGPFPYAPGERFGCFEVLPEFRSKGIGSRLLSRSLFNMKTNMIKHAYFLWTDENAARLYERFGFKRSRTFLILKKDL